MHHVEWNSLSCHVRFLQSKQFPFEVSYGSGAVDHLLYIGSVPNVPDANRYQSQTRYTDPDAMIVIHDVAMRHFLLKFAPSLSIMGKSRISGVTSSIQQGNSCHPPGLGDVHVQDMDV